MRYLLTISLALLLAACGPLDTYVPPEAYAKALELCSPYGGLDGAGTTTYTEQIEVTAYCKDGTFIEHKIARE